MVETCGLVALAPLVIGLMRTVRCRIEGRVGPPVYQPWRDIRKLLTKRRSRPQSASVVFALAPVVLAATTLVVIVLVPVVTTSPVLATGSDLFAVVFLLLLGSVVMALAALDTGSAIGGMGASRIMVVVALTEPALLVAILALAAPVKSSSLSVIVTGTLAHPGWVASPQRLLSFAAFVIVILAESGRMPVDNPATHLELTMMNEALILEYAGPDLALVSLAESLRFSVLVVLLANFFAPWGIARSMSPVPVLIAGLALIVKIGAIAVAIGAGEVVSAKLRLFRVPELLAGAFTLSVLAVLSALVIA